MWKRIQRMPDRNLRLTNALNRPKMQKDLSLEQIKELIIIMKKYPEQFGNFKEQTNKILKNLKKVELFLKDAYD